MKLVFAIVHDEDGRKVTDELNKSGFSVTKLCSTGGFLRSGNTTLLVGVEAEKLETVLSIIRKKSKSRKKMVSYSMLPTGMSDMFTPYSAGIGATGTSVVTEDLDGIASTGAVELTVGGAIIFVVNVEHFEKV